jgi:hypothetical protein
MNKGGASRNEGGGTRIYRMAGRILRSLEVSSLSKAVP